MEDVGFSFLWLASALMQPATISFLDQERMREGSVFVEKVLGVELFEQLGTRIIGPLYSISYELIELIKKCLHVKPTYIGV